MHHRTFASLVALGFATSALAQPAPLAKKIGGLGSGDFIDNPRALEYALPRVGDVNGDVLVGFADLTTLLAAWDV